MVPAGVTLKRLPSTSPANRSLATDAKSAEWRAALEAAGVRLRPL